MTITAADIKLLESEVMADTTDGGGRRTSRVIVDGTAGNIFPKVSRLDSVYGRVNLRKVFGAVQTASTDTYAGSHAVITDAPDNAKIHCTLFSTASEYDTRSSARDRIESYVTSGPESRMVLLGRQLPGQQSIVAYQRVEEPLPEVGAVFCLSNEAGSVVTSQQYFRVQSVDSEIRTFEDQAGSFSRRVVTIGTGIALRYEFNGPSSASRYSDVGRSSRIRETTVVDAARYFGIQKLGEAASQNDLSVRVASVYTPIVPTTNRETPVSNEKVGDALNLVATRASSLSETFSGTWANGAARYTQRGITPGSLTIAGSGITTVTDNKLGTISNGTFSATVDYENGVITRTGGTASPSTFSVSYTPAAAVSQPAHTTKVSVNLGNRGTVYALTLQPLPAPGTAIVDYRALGKWYRLRDKGDGSLAGSDAAYGVGTLDYTTGALVLTLGALPDVDSAVIVSWGSGTHYAARSGGSASVSGYVKQSFTLPDVPINPDSLSLTYTAGGVTYTATDNANGVISGTGISGTVNYTTGEVQLQYTSKMPDSATSVTVSYQQSVPTDNAVPVVRSTTVASAASMTVADGIVAGSLVVSANFSGNSTQYPVNGFSGPLLVRDNGSGVLTVPAGQRLACSNSATARDAVVATDQVVGTVNYATGEISVNTGVTITCMLYSFGVGGPGALNGQMSWQPATVAVTIGGGNANIGWRSSSAGQTQVAKTHDVTYTAAPVTLDITANLSDAVCPGSVMLNLGGKTYIDRSGILYYDVSSTSGAGVTAGAIDYKTGEVSLSSWSSGAGLSLSVASCLTVYGNHSDYQIAFRTPGAPLRPGSFYVQVTTESGDFLSATASDSGVISGTDVQGTVNQETGVVTLKFGRMVTAAGNESQPWYDASAVVGGQIFRPTMVLPSTLRYNCVVLANLPLNADILGLDPVRLPSDGRVPIYRPADVVVIHNTGSHTLPNPAVAGATYNVGRTGLADLWLVDQAGTKVPSSQYAVDLDAGTVTMAGTLALTGLTQPIIARHRVEDMNLLTDVQINGQLTLSAPLSRDFGTDSYVSSALLFGDMNARCTNVHDLLAFSSWSDTLGTQTQATAQYNNIDYPIEVKNNGAVTERWRINFTSTTAFQVIGENLGVIATGSTNVDCSPANQLTGQPYFTIKATGWGSGWAAGNQLRFNTISASAPVWIARTVLPGATLEGDSFSIQMRGDVDAPI